MNDFASFHTYIYSYSHFCDHCVRFELCIEAAEMISKKKKRKEKELLANTFVHLLNKFRTLQSFLLEALKGNRVWVQIRDWTNKAWPQSESTDNGTQRRTYIASCSQIKLLLRRIQQQQEQQRQQQEIAWGIYNIFLVLAVCILLKNRN